jgi:uncharacterized membrane protein YgcG
MRGIFGIVGLLMVLAIVGTLVKKQVTTISVLPQVAPLTPGAATPSPPSTASVQEQSQTLQQQVKQSVESSLEKAQQERDAKQ